MPGEISRMSIYNNVYEDVYTCVSTVGSCVVQQLGIFLSDFSEPYHDPFHVVSFSTYSSTCTCSSFSNVLALYVAVCSRSPLMSWFFLTQIILAPMYVVLVDPNHLLGHRHPCCWRLGALAYLYFACWYSWPTLPRWPMRVGRRY